ncbi:Major Facilitator Superfamily [Geosmithia morbida]|uniref:Major Facilitator Superfamily n=1 Tax=Geosmithia morbida TaxID=1094350 RepID=A0A9P4YV89_9HYPO|nr:Major Facilitator Superfamily [Geosmithia morbida]KAF4121619.1 Major Facilitator Superfamily [Geosmithia morbida]
MTRVRLQTADSWPGLSRHDAGLAGGFVICNSWGWINSFGVWQDYLPSMMPERTSLEISFIGSVTVFLLFFLGAFTGRLVDMGLFRHIFLAGSALQVVGIFCTSACTGYWQFMLAQGVCIGVANGCMFCPALALVSTYFHRRRSIALGITACGSVVGGLVFPVMARQLLPRIGFPWTVRAIGFVQLAGLVVANALSRPRIKPRRRTGPIIDLSAFKELEYTFYAIGSFSFFWGVYFAFYYLASFARNGIHDPFTFSASLDLLLIVNGVGAVGRLVPNFIADRVGAVNTLIPVCAAASLLAFCWIAVDTPASLYVWTVLYGLFAAAIQSLFPAALSLLTTDMRKIGVRMGMVFTIVSFAVLTGPPIAGAIIDSTGSYKGAQAFSGACLATGGVFMTLSKVVRMRKTGVGWSGKV